MSNAKPLVFYWHDDTLEAPATIYKVHISSFVYMHVVVLIKTGCLRCHVTFQDQLAMFH